MRTGTGATVAGSIPGRFLRKPDHIAHLHNLTYLDAAAMRITDAGVARLSGLKKLNHLEITHRAARRSGFISGFSGVDGQELSGFYAYNSGFKGGVFVSAGDVDGDGHWDVYTGAGAGGGPHVKVISGSTDEELWSFFAYAASFAGGVRVAAGDLNGDQLADILTAAGPGSGPHVRGFGGVNLTEIAGFFAYNAGFGGGVLIAAYVMEAAQTALLLEGDPQPTMEQRELLTSEQMELLRVAAIARWESAGFDRFDLLNRATFAVAELPENVLGTALDQRVLIDRDAAGAGWFIDLTPNQDEEYSLAGCAASSPARQRVDLLTVILHELGHTLGLGHIAENLDDLMQDVLAPGHRCLPTPRLVDALFSQLEQ